MLTIAVIIFALGAIGGLILASYVLRGQLAPWALSLLHAGAGALGLLIVLYAALTAGVPAAALLAFVILLIAALGGFYLASLHWRGEVAPRPYVFAHAGAAVLGFLILLGIVLGVL